MKAAIHCSPEDRSILVTVLDYVRPEGIRGANLQYSVRPGGECLGLTFDELMKLGSGRYEFEKDVEPVRIPYPQMDAAAMPA